MKSATNYLVQCQNILPFPEAVVAYVCPQCGDRFEDPGTALFPDERTFELVYDCLLCGHGLEFDFELVMPGRRRQ